MWGRSTGSGEGNPMASLEMELPGRKSESIRITIITDVQGVVTS